MIFTFSFSSLFLSDLCSYIDNTMDSLPRVLSHLSWEMCVYEIVQDILELSVIKENYKNLVLVLLQCDCLESEDVEIVLMTKLRSIESESLLMLKVIEIFDAVISTPDSVLRPYQQHFVTE